MYLDCSRALYLAAKSRSDGRVRILAELARRCRRPVLRCRDTVVDDRADKLSKEEFDKADVALAHPEIASSTMPAMAVNRPPSSEAVSEDELEEDSTIDTGLVDLGGGDDLEADLGRVGVVAIAHHELHGVRADGELIGGQCATGQRVGLAVGKPEELQRVVVRI